MDITQEYIVPMLPVDQDLETKKVLKKIISANKALAELKGAARSIPNQTILINALALQEAKDSSEIENIITTHDELYKASIDLKKVSQAAKEVQRYREALYKGFDLVKTHKILLKRHIVEIQKVLEDNDAGIRKQSGTTLKNDRTGEVVYMPPQDYKYIQDLMDNLEKYINDPGMDEYDPLVKLAVIHYQFETIHPFYDGNGRTGRIINILYLMLQELLDLPILYLSSYIIQHKADYYRLLNEVRTDNAWEAWIIYMLDGVEKTAINSVRIIEGITELMKEAKYQMRENIPKIYSKDLLESLFQHPYTKINFLVDSLGVTRKTATTYLKALEDLGILQSIKVGRDLYFVNKKLFTLLQNGIYE